VLAHTLQDVDEVGVRVDVVQPAGGDQALHDAGVFGADLGPAEQPIASAHRNCAQGSFEMVRVHRHVGVTEEDLETRTPLAHIGQRLGQRIARQQPLLLELAIDPVEERVHQRLAVGQPVQPFVLALETALADLAFDVVELADLAQRFGRGLRLGALCFEEPRLECAQH